MGKLAFSVISAPLCFDLFSLQLNELVRIGIRFNRTVPFSPSFFADDRLQPAPTPAWIGIIVMQRTTGDPKMSKHTAKTTKCSGFGHPEFTLVYESGIPQADVEALVSYLEEAVIGGTRFESGQLIAFGSMLLRVDSSGAFYTLQEPDLQSFPIAWTVDITRSLTLLRLQKDIGESIRLGEEIDPPSIGSSLLVASDLTQECDAFVLERMQPSDSDSGWFIGRHEMVLDYNDAANLNRISVYQAILTWPQLAGFLALPAGCRVDMSAKATVFSRDGTTLEVDGKSFIGIMNTFQ